MNGQDTKTLVATTALAKMIKNGYLDITTIRGIASLMGVSVGGPVFEQLQLLHCVHFHEMPPALRERLPAMIAECLSASIDFADIMRRQAEPANASDTAPRKRKWLSFGGGNHG